MNSASPSLSEIEFTMLLPCTHLSPASMTLHFEESIITGTREMAGSPARRFRKRVMAATASSIPSSKLMSITCAPASTCCRATSNASSYLSARIKSANFFEPVTLVRSPTFTKFESGPMVIGSSPESRRRFGNSGILRAGSPFTASAMALICAGVVPQQPPTKFTNPDSANSRSTLEV